MGAALPGSAREYVIDFVGWLLMLRLRRCAAVMIDVREDAEVDLASLLTGGAPIRRTQSFKAIAAHLDAEVAVDPREIAALGTLSAEVYALPDDEAAADALASLWRKRLAIADTDDDDAARADAAVRSAHWRGLSAIAHRHSRWSGVFTPDTDPDSYARSLSGLVARLGQPPEAAPQRGDREGRTMLPRPAGSGVNDLLRGRATCRNFDRGRPLPLEVAASLLHGVFGAQHAVTVPAGAEVLKKLSPSGGGLHPTEAYVLALDIAGLAPGFWHYRSKDHALDPVRMMPAAELREFALRALAGQDWFADAPMLVVHACRFERSFWKYRQHAKAYRAVILDIGHLSQTAYLLATELGLGAFVTAAINEADLERVLGLDPMREGPLAISGFGYRSAAQTHPEFDPAHAVWERDGEA
jgi:putative peptide maturation dehydrogenase